MVELKIHVSSHRESRKRDNTFVVVTSRGIEKSRTFVLGDRGNLRGTGGGSGTVGEKVTHRDTQTDVITKHVTSTRNKQETSDGVT